MQNAGFGTQKVLHFPDISVVASREVDEKPCSGLTSLQIGLTGLEKQLCKEKTRGSFVMLKAVFLQGCFKPFLQDFCHAR